VTKHSTVYLTKSLICWCGAR